MKFWSLEKFDVRFKMFEFGSISRAKCSRGSMFDLPMFEVFEVRFFDVRSKTTFTWSGPWCSLDSIGFFFGHGIPHETFLLSQWIAAHNLIPHKYYKEESGIHPWKHMENTVGFQQF